MGKPTTLLEELCRHALSFGADSIDVEYRDSCEWVFTRIEGANVRIAKYESSSSDGKELRKNLDDAAKRPMRTVLSGRVYLLKVRIHDNSGEEAFAVTIEPVPKLDPNNPPPFTRKQGQYLAFIYQYTKIHRQAPAEADLERYFRVSAPSVHEMIKTLERNGLIERTPGKARSIRLMVSPEHLPRLE